MNHSRRIILLLLFTGLIGCKHWENPIFSTNQSGIGLLILADSQVHNIYGERLAQNSLRASRAFKVAMRPPEVNILSRYALLELINQADKTFSKQLPIAVVLGDITNVACTGEYDDFMDSVSSTAKKRIWLLVHGNHDSYLSGTSNNYADNYALPLALKEAKMPVDVSFWQRNPALGKPDPTWQKACYRPAFNDHHEGAPMNKISWLARYLDNLHSAGVTVSHQREEIIDGEVVHHFRSTGTSGTLEELEYALAGSWNVPVKTTFPAYSSFLVQSLNAGEKHRLILIDTATCRYAGTVSRSNSGLRGCIGKAQLELIKEAMAEANGRNIVVAGHFPLEDINKSDRDQLIELMSLKGQWTYLSAHTHNKTGTQMRRWDGGREYNIGSTTDWPMEASLLNFSDNSEGALPAQTYRVKHDNDFLYMLETAAGSKSRVHEVAWYELCRHLPAAEALATLNLEELGSEWISPEENSNCDVELEKGSQLERESSWREKSVALNNFIEEIDRRYRECTAYRSAIQKIFAAASLHQSKRLDLDSVLHR